MHVENLSRDVECKVGAYIAPLALVCLCFWVRCGAEDTQEVTGMVFSYDRERVESVIADTYKLEGIYYIRLWLNEGQLQMGDDIMYVLIGGDIRPRVVDALNYLVGRIKDECVIEKELY